jgi:hypothetical protein
MRLGLHTPFCYSFGAGSRNLQIIVELHRCKKADDLECAEVEYAMLPCRMFQPPARDIRPRSHSWQMTYNVSEDLHSIFSLMKNTRL